MKTTEPKAPVFVWKKEWSKKAHPAANLFPMLSDYKLDEMSADIKANGLHDPIILTHDGEVLDGRNRLVACQRAEVEPDFEYWNRADDNISPTAWVISKNLHRRHLTPSQAAMVAADSLPMLEKEARERQKAAGGDQRSLSAPVRQAVEPAKGRKGKGKAAAAAAKATGVSTRLVEQAKAVIATASKADIEKVRSGEKTLKQVERETKRATQVAQAKVYRPPEGEFGIVVFDYPWKFDDERNGSEKARSGADYPKMTLEEICAFPLPVAKDCLLGCWIPSALLIDGTWERIRLSLFERYGAVPKQMRTWRKTGDDGGDVTGLGKAVRNDTEHLILLERGTVAYNLTGANHGVPIQRTGFDAPRGRGSEKPAKAYEDLAAICPMHPRINLFARDPLPGWVAHGSELPPKREGWVAESEAKESDAAPDLIVWKTKGQKHTGKGPGDREYAIDERDSGMCWVTYTQPNGVAGVQTSAANVAEAKALCADQQRGWVALQALEGAGEPVEGRDFTVVQTAAGGAPLPKGRKRKLNFPDTDSPTEAA